MPYFFLMVEGAHDAAFFGVLLRQRGFDKIKQRSKVDSYWADLIPATFPPKYSKGRLDHVVKYPDIYEPLDENDERSVAIIVAGSDGELVPEFQVALNALDTAELRAAAIVSDANGIGVASRVGQILAGLEAINQVGFKDLSPGFPLTLPRTPGFADGNPRIGIHVFPDNVNTGTLETLLLECAATSHPEFTQSAMDFVNAIDRSSPAGLAKLQRLRSGSGRQKAAAGIIGNLVFPGSALSGSVESGSWLDPVTNAETGLIAARRFLDSLLA